MSCPYTYGEINPESLSNFNVSAKTVQDEENKLRILRSVYDL